MDVLKLLGQVKSGEVEVEEAVRQLKELPFEDLGYAKLDHHRRLRCGFPETVFCQGKPDAVLSRIFCSLYERNGMVLGTRATPGQYALVSQALPQAVYDPVSRILKAGEVQDKEGLIAVCCAGTADLPVAEEAAQVAEFFGNKVDRIFDVGLSGIHRLLAQRERLSGANCIIAAAGMEGALPTVVAGLSEVPVIALPTSVGYGASFNGLSALLTMINSCANGIAVVNIDNGYGAAYIASQINRMAGKR